MKQLHFIMLNQVPDAAIKWCNNSARQYLPNRFATVFAEIHVFILMLFSEYRKSSCNCTRLTWIVHEVYVGHWPVNTPFKDALLMKKTKAKERCWHTDTLIGMIKVI